MSKLSSPEELEELRDKAMKKRKELLPCITISCGSESAALGSEKVFNALKKEIGEKGLEEEIYVRKSCCDCPGISGEGPLAIIYPDETCYINIKIEDIPEVVRSVKNGEVVDRLLYTTPKGEKIESYRDIPFFKNQERLLLGITPEIDPRNIEDYIALGGYGSLSKALFEMSPEEVIEEVKKANLRGRGGAGFPAGRKWETTRDAEGESKYVIVNCDEGDPGAYMDRTLVEGNPFSVLEGLAIGAYAIGSNDGYFYIREEYPLALEIATTAIEQAEEYGLLGRNILGSEFSLHLEVHRGAGAFVSGEESALMEAIEGRAGEPRMRYIFPAEGAGLRNRPTNINNVETWGNVPSIIEKGADWFKSSGTSENPGTKIFSLVGDVRNTGLVEIPMGTTLREIVFGIGGGIPEGREFKAVQTGGPSGGFLPEQHLDEPIDFDRLEELGSMMGSGGMVVISEDSCIVDMARFFVNFLLEESCGKCTPCREGLKTLDPILSDICNGKGEEGDIEEIRNIAETMENASLCALGRTAANPILTTLDYFGDEYEAHIKEGTCPAKYCMELISYVVDLDSCEEKCVRCLEECPADAITGGVGEISEIDQEKCTKCGMCHRVCPFDAVEKVSPPIVGD